MIKVEYSSRPMKAELARMPELELTTIELVTWLKSHLDIKEDVVIKFKAGKRNGRCRGTAPWPHMCQKGSLEINLNIHTIFHTSDINQTYEDWSHVESVGRARTYLMIVAHEMVHVKQYSHGELDAVMIRNGHSRRRVRHWMGLEWTGSKGKTHNSYKNLPWEVEAFGRQMALVDGFFKRRYLLNKLVAPQH